MIEQNYNDIVTPELSEGAIINNEFDGFDRDYLCLWCLIKKYKPKSFFEIGTNYGTGTKIIKAAAGNDAVVFSLDLPTELVHESLQPSADKKHDKVGVNCKLPFVQLRGDSMKFDFYKFPCEGYFIDGEHIYPNTFHETLEILKLKPKLIIWHDLHCIPVQEAIRDALLNNTDYDVYRILETRIAYAIKKML